VFITLLALLFFYLLFLVVSVSDTYNPIKSDAIIVLGHSIDNELNPSPWLSARLDMAINLYTQGYADIIIVSGGIGPTDPTPVALPMKTYLVDRGVPSSSILMEINSNNTYQNFKYSRVLADGYGVDSIIIVTNGFHMYRSMLLASHFFDDISVAANDADFGLAKFFAYLREPLSIVINYLYSSVNLNDYTY